MNPSDYHSQDNALRYMSNSQFGMFQKCPAKAVAVLNGDWTYTRTHDMLVGQYVDTALTTPDKLEKWKADHPEIISSKGPTKGQLLAKFRDADQVIEKIESTPQALAMLQGPSVQNQVVLTGEIHGAEWSCMVDAIDVQAGIITDLKVMKDFKDMWRDSTKMPWYQWWGYWRQMTIYTELARQTYGKDFRFRLLAATKQSPPDLECIWLDGAGAVKSELRVIESELPYYLKCKAGEVEPHLCGHCDYCRANKPFTETDGDYVT